MTKWAFPLACAITLTACGTSGPFEQQSGGADTSVFGRTPAYYEGTPASGGVTPGAAATDREAGAVSAAPHIDPDRPGAGATTGGSVTDVTGGGAVAPTTGTSDATSGGMGTGGSSVMGGGASEREAGAISSAPHIDPDAPGAGATTAGSVTDVTGGGAVAPTTGAGADTAR